MDLCIECNRVVTGRQQALECDHCNKWQHRICGTGISQQEYREAVRSREGSSRYYSDGSLSGRTVCEASEGQIPIKHRSITNVVARIHSWPEKCHFVGTGSQQYHAVNLLF